MATPKHLKNIDVQIKFKFLAFLAEVYSFADVASLDRKHAIRLFQWHFYYTYINPKTKYLFWNNLINTSVSTNVLESEIDTEIQKPYWQEYFLFAKEAEKKMRAEKSI